jgi:hypothetical protein
LNKQKYHFFFFYKIREQKGGIGPAWGRVDIRERGEEVGYGKGGRIWCEHCVHMYVNGKMMPVETVPGMGEGG